MKTTNLMQCQLSLLRPISCLCEPCCCHPKILTACWTKARVFLYTEPHKLRHSQSSLRKQHTTTPLRNKWRNLVPMSKWLASRDPSGLKRERAWMKIFSPAFKEKDFKNWLQILMRFLLEKRRADDQQAFDCGIGVWTLNVLRNPTSAL